MNNNTYLAVPDVCALLGVSDRTLRKLTNQPGGLRSTRVGGSVRFSKADVADWLQAAQDAELSKRRRGQSQVLSECFGQVDAGEDLDLEVKGTLCLHVTEDGQTWIGFEGIDGTSLSFECLGFKKDGPAVWSTGDITIRRIGGNNDAAQ